MMNLRNRAALTAAIEAAERFVDVIRSLYSDLGPIDDVEPIAHTVRRRSDGLRMIEFRDAYQVPCSIQESSAADPHVWVGCNENAAPVDGEPVSPRMHLTRDHARLVVERLQCWIDTGSLLDPKTEGGGE